MPSTSMAVQRIVSSEWRTGKRAVPAIWRTAQGVPEILFAISLFRHSLALRGLMAQLRIGTRGSPLALAQARTVRARLAATHGLAEDDIELSVIKTSGDMVQDRPL